MDALRRAVRTALQAFLGAVIGSGLLSAIGEQGVVDWSVAKKVVFSAAAAAIAALISWAYNALEDVGAVPKVMKS